MNTEKGANQCQQNCDPVRCCSDTSGALAMSNHGSVIGGTVSMPRHHTTHTHTDENSHSLDIRCCLLGNIKTQWHETLSRGPRPLEPPSNLQVGRFWSR